MHSDADRDGLRDDAPEHARGGRPDRGPRSRKSSSPTVMIVGAAAAVAVIAAYSVYTHLAGAPQRAARVRTGAAEKSLLRGEFAAARTTARSSSTASSR